jgi:hypothetical protein
MHAFPSVAIWSKLTQVTCCSLFSGKWKSVLTSAAQFFTGLASADLAAQANLMGCPVEEQHCYDLVLYVNCTIWPCAAGGRCDCHWTYYDPNNPDSGGYCEDNDPGNSESICPTKEVRRHTWHHLPILSATFIHVSMHSHTVNAFTGDADDGRYPT